MKKIKDIIKGISNVTILGDPEKLISKIGFDSREITENSMFVAVKGSRSDGHDYIRNVIDSGASAIICEEIPDNPEKKICWIKTTDSAKALGIAASNFYGKPSESLKLVGVTGTNGKTTIATLLYRMFTGLGYKMRFILHSLQLYH